MEPDPTTAGGGDPTGVTDQPNPAGIGTERGGSWAELDLERCARVGQPEVVYGAGKTPTQVAELLRALLDTDTSPILATRVSEEHALACRDLAEHDPDGRVLIARRRPPTPRSGLVVVVSAGTSDLPVAAEARSTLAALGHRTDLIVDVGVAGIHRVLAVRDQLREADVVVVVAGMEGTLPAVVAGLVGAPVVAVPTSVGYGACFDGLAALLGMLAGCAPGVSVVNIDNGFGAAMVADRCLGARPRGGPDRGDG